MTFGNAGSSQRLFRRVPSDSSTSGQLSPTSAGFEVVGDENHRPNTVEANSKEAMLGRRLYAKALDPTLAELHAQTSSLAKREALAKLADAFAVLNSVDPEGAFHMLRGLNASVAQDAKLANAFLPGPPAPRAAAATTTTVDKEGTPPPAGTVIIKSTPTKSSQGSPKLVLAASNPHLKSHKRRQESIASSDNNSSPTKTTAFLREKDAEKAALEAKYPGREARPGMEHCKQLSDVLYGRWADNLRSRWPNA